MLSRLAPLKTAATIGLMILLAGCETLSGLMPGSHQRLSIAEAGAIGDGSTMNTMAIQKAIDQVAEGGGGTVVVPEGTFLSGAIFLKPGVNLHLDEGAVLKGSTDTKDYPTMRTRIEGHFQDWLPALINADGLTGLVIDGEGTLDGSGEPFYKAFYDAIRTRRGTANLDVPRPRLLYIANCHDVTIAGLHLLNSGFWNIHLYKDRHVTIDGIDIKAPADSPSTDGIDIDSSQWVTIQNCVIANSDDCIALKGTKGVDALEDKDSPPVEHIRVLNCQMPMGESIVTCGSEATIVRDVIVDNCSVLGNASRGVRILRLKLRSDTPQTYEDMHIGNITLDGAGTLIDIQPWSQYENLQGQQPPAHTVQNISLTNIKGTFGSFGSIRPYPQDTVKDLTLENIDVKLTGNATPRFSGIKGLVVKNVKVNGDEYTPPAEFTQPAN